MKLTDYIQRKLKAPNYHARAGQSIAGALGRGNDGKFTRAGSSDGTTPPPATDRQKRNADRAQARLDAADQEQKLREQEDAKIAAGKNGKERQKLRAQVQADRRKRAMERKRASLTQQQSDAAERQAKLDAPKDPKEPKPKKGGGGGKGAKPKPEKPTDEAKRTAADAAKAKMANATASKVGLAGKDLDEMRSLSTTNAGNVGKRLMDLGFAQDDGNGAGFGLSDQGRRALGALERGDVRGYQAAVQDARARLRREGTASKRQADIATRRAALAAKRNQPKAAPTPRHIAGARKEAPSLAVFKDAQGNDRWLAITTTAYQDQDEEYISRRAIADAVRWGDKSGERGVLRYWHVKGFDLGDCDFQTTAADGRMLIESGTFRSKAAANLGRRMAQAGWQMSPGFLHPPNEPSNKVYDHILLFERSPCPPGKASNPYTRFVTKETPMDAHKYEQLKSLVGDEPELLATLEATIQATDKQAQESGATFKETDAPPAWAQSLISRLDALEATLKAAPADAMIGQAADAIAGAAGELDAGAPEEGALETPEEEKAEALLSPDEITAIAQAVAAAIAPMFDVEKKLRAMTDEIKGTMGGFTAAKEAEAASVGKLDARIKQLEGETPIAAGYRASADPQTVLPAAFVEALKASPHTVSTNGAVPNPSADPIGSFLNGFNLGGSR